jgi:hypothetical protein
MEDCSNIDASHLTTTRTASGKYVVVSGSEALMGFDTAAQANNARNIITTLRMDRLCYVGRPWSSFSYSLAGGSIPSASTSGESCRYFDNTRLRVAASGGAYVLRDAGFSVDIASFTDKLDAYFAKGTVRRYGASRQCAFDGASLPPTGLIPTTRPTYFKR